ncbi:hypothetical protein LF599_06525 [Pseudodesulfovibrio thermohalotolerans]|uniref:hypothetical protein n=1 Tax=Pseudodesulfovibrio thermohalotolerans TaxID=2880651 RepID=UPI002441A3FD|nr:hypothetical protein [Pseudodesulfovibrio thermohalotolerans]WFS63813.1 hypothetical protein LF599_06525 [Pseudodesulfovibrio thermohalotolerans]
MGSKRIIKTDDGLSLDATGYAGRYLLVDQSGEVKAATDTWDAICAFAAVLAHIDSQIVSLSAYDGMTGERCNDEISAMVTAYLPYVIDALIPAAADDVKRAVYRHTRELLVATGAAIGIELIDELIH